MSNNSEWKRASVRAVLALLVLLGATTAKAVVLDDDKRITAKLEDGTDVVLYGEAKAGGGKVGYYYLPPRLTIARSDNGKPEFLFIKYITDASAAAGGMSGGLLHFLVKWGLTPAQEAKLRQIVETEHHGELKGAAPMFAQVGNEPSFSIVSATVSDDGTRKVLFTNGKAPLMPGGRAVAAARLDANGASLLAKTFEEASTITDVSAVFNMAYETQLSAAKGVVTIDWSRIERDSQRIEAEYKRTNTGREKGKKGCFLFFCTSSEDNVYEYSYDEMRSEYNYLVESKYITFEFEERVADERVAKIREAFINYFINSMSQPAEAPAADRTGGGEAAAPADLDIKQGTGYKYNVNRIKQVSKRGKQEFRMDYKLTLRWPFQLVGNMKSWYAEATSDPHAVQSVILDQKFYQWRDIVFLVDAEDSDLYGSELNYATINVRKQRDHGVFEDSVTIDADHIKKSGTRAVINYARGDDNNSDVYEYKVKMSFRGGKQYPAEPRWTKGDWEGVTIASPLKARTIELEGDLKELAAAGVTRVTAQIHYPRLGEEKEENIQLSVAGDEAIVKKKIFMADDAEGYVYRLVLNHKKQGRLALPWTKVVSDDYIFAVVPEELVTNLRDEIVEGVVKVAKDAVTKEAGDQLAKFNILIKDNH